MLWLFKGFYNFDGRMLGGTAWMLGFFPRKGSPPSSGSQVFVGSFVVREHLHALPLEAIWVRLIAER